MEHLEFRNGAVNLHAVAAGPKNGPAVILLHGFPEFWFGWRKHIDPLARAGCRVIVPDQRGYVESSKPKGAGSYGLCDLSSDVIAIANALERDRVFLAGHDWGAAVAWHTAAYQPDRIERLAILNSPHPEIMLRVLLRKPGQLVRSWYVFFFQLPLVPELVMRARNFRTLTASLLKTSQPGTFTNSDLERYREAWRTPGALTAMVNWYRAILRYPAGAKMPKIQPPTLVLWGRRDRFLVPELAEASLAHCRTAELVWLPNATHWLQHEELERVSKELIRWFTVYGAPPTPR